MSEVIRFVTVWFANVAQRDGIEYYFPIGWALPDQSFRMVNAFEHEDPNYELLVASNIKKGDTCPGVLSTRYRYVHFECVELPLEDATSLERLMSNTQVLTSYLPRGESAFTSEFIQELKADPSQYMSTGLVISADYISHPLFESCNRQKYTLPYLDDASVVVKYDPFQIPSMPQLDLYVYANSFKVFRKFDYKGVGIGITASSVLNVQQIDLGFE